jgi:hypothetical protein
MTTIHPVPAHHRPGHLPGFRFIPAALRLPRATSGPGSGAQPQRCVQSRAYWGVPDRPAGFRACVLRYSLVLPGSASRSPHSPGSSISVCLCSRFRSCAGSRSHSGDSDASPSSGSSASPFRSCHALFRLPKKGVPCQKQSMLNHYP